jgi:hypothetical protein
MLIKNVTVKYKDPNTQSRACHGLLTLYRTNPFIYVPITTIKQDIILKSSMLYEIFHWNIIMPKIIVKQIMKGNAAI